MSTWPCVSAAASSTSRTWARSKLPVRGAAALLQRLLSNDISKIGIGGAQYSVLCDEKGGVIDDLFTYRLGPERYLTVSNASNHERDLAWFSSHAGDFDVELHDRLDDYAMLAVQGPLAREIVQAISDAPLPARMTTATRRLAGAEVLVCGTGYTGEDGVELLLAPEDAPALWEELCRRGAVPAGLAARDTLRLEACFHLYGNDLSLERNPIEAGLGWCCREDTSFVGAEPIRAARAALSSVDSSTSERVLSPAGRHRRSLLRLRSTVRESRVRATRSWTAAWSRAARSRPVWAPASAWPMFPPSRQPRHCASDRRPWQDSPGDRQAEAALSKGQLKMSSYPDDLLYHPEHDWARIDAEDPDVAMLGITWFAQDALGEVVFFDPPSPGTIVHKDEPYAEVESVKAVSDVVAPLSGEIVEVNEKLADSPNAINDDPYGEGWLVKVRMSDPTEREALLDADAYSATLGA